MTLIAVVDRPEDWPAAIPGVRVVAARDYLGDTSYAETASVSVHNLCTADRYQGRGYYVSLIAEARGQAPEPDVKTMEAVASRRTWAKLGSVNPAAGRRTYVLS